MPAQPDDSCKYLQDRDARVVQSVLDALRTFITSTSVRVTTCLIFARLACDGACRGPNFYRRGAGWGGGCPSF